MYNSYHLLNYIKNYLIVQLVKKVEMFGKWNLNKEMMFYHYQMYN